MSGIFSLGVPVDDLFFIGNQLVATSHTGKVGVWNAVTQHWQVGLVFCYSKSAEFKSFLTKLKIVITTFSYLFLMTNNNTGKKN